MSDDKQNEEKLNEIHRALIGDLKNPGGLMGRLASLEKAVTDHVGQTQQFRKDLLETVGTNSKRITAIEGTIEKAKAQAAGIIAGSGLGGGTIGAIVNKFFGG